MSCPKCRKWITLNIDRVVKVAQIKLGLDLVKSQDLYRLEINICKSEAQCNADVDWIMKYLRLTAWYFKKEKDIASARNTLKNVHNQRCDQTVKNFHII